MDEDEIIIEDEDLLETEQDEEENTIDLEDITDDESEEDDDNTDDVEEEEQEDNEQEEEELDYKALYEAEQKKRKDLQSALYSERKQRKQTVKKTDITSTETYKELISKGVDAEIAETLAKSVEKRSEETSSQIEDLRFEAAIAKASKKSGFEDIEEYAEDIRPFVDKGLTIEQAYYVATGERGKTNTKAEVKRKIEAKMQNQKAKSKIKDIDTSGGNGSSKTTEKYSPMDIQMAKAFGISTKDYIKFKKINSEKDYEKMKNRG